MAEQWFASVQELVRRGRRSPTTVAFHCRVLDSHVLPSIGELRLSELSTARMDHFIHQTVGEALGVCWQDVDLDRHVVHVRRTFVRVPGEGLLAKPPKTRSGVRVLRLPLWLVELLMERRDRLVLVEVGPVFPDSLGGFRDRNNVERDFRQVRKGTAYEWVVPHTYRKTVATLLDDTGLGARTIADQLGHSRVSMTQDRYMGRRAVNEAVASARVGLMGQKDSGEPPPTATLSVE